jgi:hypothetical protein
MSSICALFFNKIKHLVHPAITYVVKIAVGNKMKVYAELRNHYYMSKLPGNEDHVKYIGTNLCTGQYVTNM